MKSNVEKTLLKHIINNKLYVTLAESKLKSSYFSDKFKSLYQFLIFYYRRNNAIITPDILNLLFSMGQYKSLTSDMVNIYNSLIEETDIDDLSEENFNSNANILKFQYAREEIIDIAKYIIECNNQTIDATDTQKIITEVSDRILKINSDDTIIRKSSSIIESIDEQLDNYLQIYHNPNSIEYIPTGFDAIDSIEGGFRKSELIYVIGRKGTGKSILLLNLAYNACKAKKNILLFSLEISKEDYERRLTACAASISSNRLKRGNLTEDEYKQYKLYIEKLKEHKTIDDKEMGEFVIIDVPSSCTPSFIESQLVLEQRKRNIKFDVVVIDYAGIMLPDSNVAEKRHQQGIIALNLKQIARKYDCAVYSASQMSRQGRNDINQKNGHADSAHIAESDQVADHIDWGIAIKITDIEDQYGTLESFKTRDAAPFAFQFLKNYSMMQMKPIQKDNKAPADPSGKYFKVIDNTHSATTKVAENNIVKNNEVNKDNF